VIPSPKMQAAPVRGPLFLRRSIRAPNNKKSRKRDEREQDESDNDTATAEHGESFIAD